MTLPSPTGDDELPLTLLRQVDDVCGRFEAAWEAASPEGRPRIEASLDTVPEPARAQLVNELVALEIELRRRAGEHPEQAEYQARVLPAPAEQMSTETSRCRHARERLTTSALVRRTS